MRMKVFGLLILALMVGVLVLTSFTFAIGESAFGSEDPATYFCGIVPANQCSGANTIMNLSASTNAHGYLSGAAPYKLCCNFKGSSSCGTADAVMYLSSTSNAHAEMVDYDSQCIAKPDRSAHPIDCSDYTTEATCKSYGCGWNFHFWPWGYTCEEPRTACSSITDLSVCDSRADCNVHLIPEQPTYQNEVCFAKGMKCVGINNPSLSLCPETEADGVVYNIEVASLSAEINAHIGNFSDYPVKVCCSEFCEMYKTNPGCWNDSAMQCTWTPGRTKIYPAAGCCDKEFKWNNQTKRCIETQDLCNSIWVATIDGQNYNEEVFGEPTLWNMYCAQVTPGLTQGMKFPTIKY